MGALPAMMTFQTGNRASGSARGDRAFTLIELMLVMAMLLIVIGVSAPSLSKFFRGRTLDSEARRFLALTRYGQSRAVAEGVPMVLWMDAKQGTYGLEQDPAFNDQDDKAKAFELGKNITIQAADLPAPSTLSGQSARPAATANGINLAMSIRFLPDGFIAETSPRSVYLREGGSDLVLITQSRNGLNYEIETNAVRAIR